jgi:hypothetical protein
VLAVAFDAVAQLTRCLILSNHCLPICLQPDALHAERQHRSIPDETWTCLKGKCLKFRAPNAARPEVHCCQAGPASRSGKREVASKHCLAKCRTDAAQSRNSVNVHCRPNKIVYYFSPFCVNGIAHILCATHAGTTLCSKPRAFNSQWRATKPKYL